MTLRTVATATLTPVAYGGKPAYSAGFTATEWLDLSKLSKTD
ncbi:MAG: hypothetical protein V7L00_23760 [Nostoc sp.]